MKHLLLTILLVPLALGLFQNRIVTVAHYNVGVFTKYYDNSMAMVAAMFDEMGADAVSLNELDSCTTRTGGIDQLKAICDSMGGWQYNFSPAIRYAGGLYGVGTAVRPDTKVLMRRDVKLPKFDGGEQRALSILETEDYVICTSHLDYAKGKVRPLQAAIVCDTLEAMYGDSQKLVVLCGDFNDSPSSPALDVIRTRFTVVSDTTFTWPNTAPRQCIDYICILRNNARYSVLDTKVRTEFEKGDVLWASDHLPVYATIRYKAPATSASPKRPAREPRPRVSVLKKRPRAQRL